MTSSDHSVRRDLVAALQTQAAKTGSTTPSVRGSDWRLATVTAAPGDGTVIADGIPARCMPSYARPAVGDVVVLDQSSTGNWLCWGPTSTGPVPWTTLTLASGYVNPGHGYVPAWRREGDRIYLRGRIGLTGGGGIPNVTPLATIPAAIRPAGALAIGWACARDGGLYPATVRVEITADGLLRTYDISSPLPTWVALDGITYTI